MVYPKCVEEISPMSPHETAGYMQHPTAEFGQFEPIEEQVAVIEQHEAQTPVELAGRLATNGAQASEAAAA
jgi:hypothetical protein